MENQFSKSPQLHFSLIGAGIMSATLAVLLKELLPEAEITLFERMDEVAAESSNAWNNAGTGHSAYCELNYTPQKEDGSIDISKAVKIAQQFDVSRKFWTYLLKQGHIQSDGSFIQSIPHMSFVWGDENCQYLKKRYEALVQNKWFEGMLFSEDYDEIASWIPLVMKGRNKNQKIAATRMVKGTDINFGALTKGMIAYLQKLDGVEIRLGYEIDDLQRTKEERWSLQGKNVKTEEDFAVVSDFVFIGAGGAAITLLEKSDLPEGKGYGGFPVSGEFFQCNNPQIIDAHFAKVYGKAEAGSPPMSVPHLDARLIDGKRSLLFGPYAGFSTKFLKNGSYFDLPLSIDSHNIWPLLVAGYKNMDLTKYLVQQVIQSDADRLDLLRKYYPEAQAKDWELITAGQRVQIIKKDAQEGGVLQFGTEVVASADGSLAALLGASPGASTSVSIMLEVLQKCFPSLYKSDGWQEKLNEILPEHDFGHL